MKLNPNFIEAAKKICEASKTIGESEYDLVLFETFELVDSYLVLAFLLCFINIVTSVLMY